MYNINFNEYSAIIGKYARIAKWEYDDFYQESVINMLNALDKFDISKGSMRQHLISSIKYTALNANRKKRIYPVYMEDYLMNTEFNEMKNEPIDNEDTIYDQPIIHGIVNNDYKLDMVNRNILLLYIVYGYTLQEIGNKFSLSYQGVKNILDKSLIKIRKIEEIT